MDDREKVAQERLDAREREYLTRLDQSRDKLFQLATDMVESQAKLHQQIETCDVVLAQFADSTGELRLLRRFSEGVLRKQAGFHDHEEET